MKDDRAQGRGGGHDTRLCEAGAVAVAVDAATCRQSNRRVATTSNNNNNNNKSTLNFKLAHEGNLYTLHI